MNDFTQREAGRTPVQRNTFYEPIKVLADGPLQAATNEAEPPSGKSQVLEDDLATACQRCRIKAKFGRSS